MIPLSRKDVSTVDFPSLETAKSSFAGALGQYYSIADYHQAYLAGKITPLAVAEALLPLIRRDISEKSHHSTAWIECRVEAVLEAARQSTERYAAGRPLSIFDGVPTGVKDEADVVGYSTTSGRRHNGCLFPVQNESAHAAKLFAEAGAIIIGKCK